MLSNLNRQVEISNLWLTDVKGRGKDIRGNYLSLCHPDGITSAALRTCRNAAWVWIRSSQRQSRNGCLLGGKGSKQGPGLTPCPPHHQPGVCPPWALPHRCVQWRERQNSQKLSREQQEGCASCKTMSNCTAIAQAHLHLYYFPIIKIQQSLKALNVRVPNIFAL